MPRYKYKAINSKGRPIRGNIAANSEVDLYKQLQSASLELIDCSVQSSKTKGGFHLGQKKIKLRDVIQLFVQLEQMQSAGVPLLDALSDVRDSTEHDGLRDIMSEIFRDVSDGAALSEAMIRHPKIFKPLYISLIEAGEETGDMTSSYLQLVKYLKWVDVIQGKIRKATRYPMIVTGVVILTIVFMMSIVVPQIVGFLEFLDLELPIYSKALIATSNFFIEPQFNLLGFPVYGSIIVIIVPIILIGTYHTLKRGSDTMAYRFDAWWLQAPVFGPLIRKISIARYAQTFGALYASGIDVISALENSRATVNNLMMLDAMESVEGHVKAGSALSEAFNASGEFPSLVVRMVKVGEESGNLTPVLDQVSDFYTNDVNEAIEGLIEMIQPTLTAILGLVIAWIAAGSLGPIYMNLGNFMDF
ncbi:MAG: type II secretion system F family protein [Rhodospirillales bacterium]|nr:type II secretion system F family protein [Rhodospirillales bacterium]